MNFLRECWGWEGGNLLPLQNSFTSDGWSSFLQPRCSSLGHNQENPRYILNASRCTVSKVKQKPHQTTYPNSCAAPKGVKKRLWPGECSNQTLLGSLGASLPSYESLKNCCWWAGKGTPAPKALSPLRAQPASSHPAVDRGLIEMLIWGLIALPGKPMGASPSDENPSCTTSFLDFLE